MTDLWCTKEIMTIKDLEYLCMKMIDDESRELYEIVDYMEIKFLNAKTISNLEEAVEKGLGDVSFTKNTLVNSVKYTIDDSPISEIEIFSDKFILHTNPDKWEVFI